MKICSEKRGLLGEKQSDCTELGILLDCKEIQILKVEIGVEGESCGFFSVSAGIVWIIVENGLMNEVVLKEK